MPLIIFTDLDGTLLNQEDYDYQPAIPMLEKFKQKGVPIIPVTSKTRAEVAQLREDIGLNDPFIVENGSGIFVPQKDDRFGIAESTLENKYTLQLLGCNYQEARAGLKQISADLGEDLRGFGDLSSTELQSLTGLPLEEVQLAQTREFTEPFITPKHIPTAKIEQTAAKYNFRVLVGDRFSHLIAASAGKGKAVNWLLKNYQTLNPTDKVMTVGLGNSPNDLEMLESVDIPLVIASRKGVHPGLKDKGWEVPNSPGSQGWAEATAKIYQKFFS